MTVIGSRFSIPRAVESRRTGAHLREIVEAAAVDAGSTAPRFTVPFPGNGQQISFQKEMARILPQLPGELGELSI